MSKNTDYTGLEIAIIGMAGRFPGAKNIDAFWENLVNGKETISFFTEEELLEAGVDPGELANPNYVKAYGYLEDIEYFDAAFFGYTDTEATFMDPQIRIFLECAWEGLEDAAYNPGNYNGLIGLYTGAAAHYDWVTRAFSSGEILTLDFFAGHLLINRDLLAGWVSYKLDLKGPSITMITACSTSLVAIHSACQAILNGECDMAIAGGVSIGMLEKSGYIHVEGLPASPDGHIRAFDAGPHGIVGGNGAVVVVLKPLADAREDRDHIYALIKGSAINNDGIDKVGFAAPSVEGQARAIKAALGMAEVDPETIGYVETHGTATELGDPVEIQGLTLGFKTKKRQYCRIGSVKTNIGHLDTAAGAAGLVKAALCIYHGIIPPSLNYQRPNPKIDFENTPFYVNATLSEWQDENNPLRAGVSSFGIGGTNAHAILQEAPPVQAPLPGRPFQLFLLSAGTGAALDRNTQNLGMHLEKNPGIHLSDVAYTLQTGRKIFPYRRIAVTSSREQAARDLSLAGPESLQTRMVTMGKRALVFIFSGQGTQYVNMGLGLYRQEPQFREEMDRGFQILSTLCDFDMKEILYPPAEEITAAQEKIADFRCGGPITLLFEYALATLLIKWGLRPEALIGYSFGEYAAACLSGVFSLEEALKLAVLRGRLMFDMPTGAMLGVTLSGDELKHLAGSDIAIAAVNGPAYCVVSGAPNAIERFQNELEAKGHECFNIQLPRAGHSPLMAPYAEKLKAQFAGLRLNAPGIPYMSGLTGTWITAPEATSPQYWARHMVETTRFADGIGRLIQELDPIFIQVGADRQLPLYVGLHPLKKEENLALNLVRRPKYDVHDTAYLLNAIGQLWLWGVDINWKSFYAHEERARISLPAYSFERTRYPFLSKTAASAMPVKTGTGSPAGQAESALKTGSPHPAVQTKRKRANLRAPYAPANDPLEQQLVEIFQSFFGVEPVGIYDDFYELGGDSLRAVQLTGMIKKTVDGMTISIRQLLYYQNIHDLCAGLRKEGGITGPQNTVEKVSPGSGEKSTLIDEISPAGQLLIEKKLDEAGRLSGLLKKNKWTHTYEISPVQASWLPGSQHGMSTDFIYYFHEFSYPNDHEKISAHVRKIMQRNSLLRSVIIDEKGNYYIKEFDSFANIELPLIDLSIYTAVCRETIIDRLITYINKPMAVFDHVLFRAWVFKMDHTGYKLLIQFNHLICDGACIDILDKQFHALAHGWEDPPKKNAPVTEYYDYVRFMKEQNYNGPGLDNYLKPKDYLKANQAILKKYKIADTAYESFVIDISLIDAKIKVYYNEIAFLAFAELIGDLFGTAPVPVEYITNGRIYKDGDFNHIIGDFHDTVPVLVSLGGEPGAEIERFIAYNRFIKENKLNFMNYIYKGHIAGWDSGKETWRSPFIFNALIGSYEFFNKPFHENRLATLNYTSPHFEMLLLEDFSAAKLWISFIQNAGVTVKEKFLDNYRRLHQNLTVPNATNLS